MAASRILRTHFWAWDISQKKIQYSEEKSCFNVNILKLGMYLDVEFIVETREKKVNEFGFSNVFMV